VFKFTVYLTVRDRKLSVF